MKLAVSALVVVPLVIFGTLLPAAHAQCSQDDASTAAIEECVNAVRQNPQYWSNFAPCDFSRYPAVPPLSVDSALTQAAQVHSHSMASWGFINHNGFKGRVRGAGYNGPSISENVASGYRSALDVVMGWMCSPGHARNMMDWGMESMGTGVDCTTRAGKCFYTQTFGGSGRCGVQYGGAPSPATGAQGGFLSGGLLGRLMGLIGGGGGGGSTTSTGTTGLFGSGLGGPISSLFSRILG